MKTNPGATLLKPAKPPDSNYESPALTAELQAQFRRERGNVALAQEQLFDTGI
jgi:hypothetical protein